MPSEEETTGGARIVRHEARDREYQAPGDEGSLAEEVEKHFECNGVVAESVFHELVSDMIHLDVHISAPSQDRPFYTLFTTGMADIPMSPPEGYEEFARAELMLCLPPDWPLEQGDEESHWPIKLLKFLARLPHEYKSWLSLGHSVPNEDPPTPYAKNTELCGALVTSPLTLPEVSHQFESSKGPVNILAVIPMHETEMALKLEKGTAALHKLFDAKSINEVLIAGRRSACRRGFWNLFKK